VAWATLGVPVVCDRLGWMWFVRPMKPSLLVVVVPTSLHKKGEEGEVSRLLLSWIFGSTLFRLHIKKMHQQQHEREQSISPEAE
jgi:hypothetical protein